MPALIERKMMPEPAAAMATIHTGYGKQAAGSRVPAWPPG
jgi:hypothetical protein